VTSLSPAAINLAEPVARHRYKVVHIGMRHQQLDTPESSRQGRFPAGAKAERPLWQCIGRRWKLSSKMWLRKKLHE
jgi:hypothetical protein